jgi:thiol-disulfide isomerase/thioredoxin
MTKKTAMLLMFAVLLVSACRRQEQAVTETSGTAPQKKPAVKSAPPAPVGTEVGSTMPAYSATFLDGSKFDLAARRDKVVLLNLWATWCGPCREEIPELQKLHDKYGPKGFEVVGVSVDEGPVSTVQEFIAEQKMTYPIALDAEGKLASILETSVLPSSVLIDRTGRIVWKRYSYIPPDDPELVSAIEKALSLSS